MTDDRSRRHCRGANYAAAPPAFFHPVLPAAAAAADASSVIDSAPCNIYQLHKSNQNQAINLFANVFVRGDCLPFSALVQTLLNPFDANFTCYK